MIVDKGYLLQSTLRRLGYTPLPSQLSALKALVDFAVSRPPMSAFILNGYAGTGKTSLVGALIAAMRDVRMRTVILAPTGRAAKVAEKYSTRRASTIHRHIYSYDTLSQTATLGSGKPDTLYIVDEASMVTDLGNRSMLRDLIKFVYSIPGSAMVLVGDNAQLPPIGQDDSPAMSPGTLRKYGIMAVCRSLRQPVRQASESGILCNATIVRRHIEHRDLSLPPLAVSGFDDVSIVSFYDFADAISSSWAEVGKEETLIITRSNSRVNQINSSLRAQVLFAEEPLERGERLVISKNNYFWTRAVKGISFLANGETVTAGWCGNVERVYGHTFADIELSIPGNDSLVSAKIMLDSLNSEGPALPAMQMQTLYNQILATKDGTPNQRAFATLEDEYYNAIQAKYAYCMTCHKAQGGQWRHIYIDLSALMLDAIDESFFRWLYTALTRATDRVYFINPSIPITQ